MEFKGRFYPFKLGVMRAWHPFALRPHLMRSSPRMNRLEWERKNHGCQYYDPYKSFVPGEPGYEAERLWSKEGRPSAIWEAWDLGRKAYSILSDRLGIRPTNKQLRTVRDEMRALDAIAAPVLREKISGGQLGLIGAKDREDALKIFDDADFPWRLHLAYRVWHQFDIPTDPGLHWEATAAACCLFELDWVALMPMEEGGVEAFFDAKEFLDSVQTDTRIVAEAEKLAQERKAKEAREAASKRHEPSRKVRELAIELYAAGQWNSRRDAVRRLMPRLMEEAEVAGLSPSEDRFPQTVYEWLTKYDQETRLPADV